LSIIDETKNGNSHEKNSSIDSIDLTPAPKVRTRGRRGGVRVQRSRMKVGASIAAAAAAAVLAESDEDTDLKSFTKHVSKSTHRGTHRRHSSNIPLNSKNSFELTSPHAAKPSSSHPNHRSHRVRHSFEQYDFKRGSSNDWSYTPQSPSTSDKPKLHFTLPAVSSNAAPNESTSVSSSASHFLYPNYPLPQIRHTNLGNSMPILPSQFAPPGNVRSLNHGDNKYVSNRQQQASQNVVKLGMSCGQFSSRAEARLNNSCHNDSPRHFKIGPSLAKSMPGPNRMPVIEEIFSIMSSITLLKPTSLSAHVRKADDGTDLREIELALRCAFSIGTPEAHCSFVRWRTTVRSGIFVAEIKRMVREHALMYDAYSPRHGISPLVRSAFDGRVRP